MKNKKTFIILIIIILIFTPTIYYFNYLKPLNEVKELNTDNIIINDNTINLDSLTLKQKIAQMIMVRGDDKHLNFDKLNVGGIFLDKQKSQEDYQNVISFYKKNSKIKLLVSTDLEGSWTPFPNPEPHQVFPKFSEIKTIEEAGEIGLKHGELLKEIGFNLNFAPVAEYSDDVYGGRTFSGNDEEINKKLELYIQGLQKNALGTCKHYPGKAMQKNLHYVSDKQVITYRDMKLFETCLKNNISSIMVSHQIAKGVVDSEEKPSSVSSEVISTIPDSILIIADEINMKGLKNFYPDKTKLYIDLINSGENLILDFDLSPVELYKLIKEIEAEVEKGKIDKNKIDKSVRKILITKGYMVE